MALIIFCFRGNKMCKFYHVLLARYKPFKGVSKTFFKYFVKFQETKYYGSFIIAKSSLIF